jgi:signal transduction histidine kinase/ligand-binding sensor domain-containing protein
VNVRSWRRTLVVLATLIPAIPIRLFAQPQPPANFIRAHFTEDDGLPGSVVDQIGQTADGFLWMIVNANHLVRFDGRTFYTFEQRPSALAHAAGGGLWLGVKDALIDVQQQDLSRFNLHGVTYHPGPGKETAVNCLRVGRSGVLWIGTDGGLFRYDGGAFVPLGPRVRVHDIEETPDGHLLVMIKEAGFFELDGSAVVPRLGLADRLGVKDADIFHVLKDRRGNTWYSTALGVVRESGGRFEKVGAFAPRDHAAYRTYEDAEGAVWIAKDEGVFRATDHGLESFAPWPRVRSFFSDRDGNIWVGTNGDGLYRFKRSSVRMYTKDDGLPGNIIQTVMTTRDGSLWAGANCGGLSRFDGARFQTYSEQNGLLNSCVYAIAEDGNRDLWIGTWGGGAFRFHDGAFTPFSKAQGMADDRVTEIIAARDGTIWFGTLSGVSRLKDGQMRNFKLGDGPANSRPLAIAEDRSGALWAGTRDGLHRFVGDSFERSQLVPHSVIMPVGERSDVGLLIADDGKRTMIRVKDNRVETVAGLPVAYDMIETAEGDLWLGGETIERLPRGALARARTPDEPLDYETLSVADGLATPDTTGSERSFAQTRDGRLWVATAKGLARVDLDTLRSANSKPSIYITNVTIGRKASRPSGEIVVPAGTSHLQIDFSAIEVTAPEKSRLQYRLDDVDSEWLDAGRDPRAIYTRLPAGKHALRIRASNRSGIWDRQGVVFSVTQEPFFYQTRAFVVIASIGGLLLIVGGYRLRVRQISRAMSARFDERLAERTRVAREVHDTLLQTVQASKMVADHALKNAGDHERMSRAMEQLAAWLARATEEGRAALHSLRASTTEKNDLSEAFRRAINECRDTSRATVSFSVHGASRQMHPVVRDEVYRIGYEAIRNACAHSGAGRIDVELRYDRDLVVRVADSGAGMHAAMIDGGKPGHFGLQGMRERAARIGGELRVVSAPGMGTEIVLAVPGRAVFVRHSSSPPVENHR